MRRFLTIFLRIVVILSMTGVVPAFSQEMEYLGNKDVKAIMEQIFDRHINKKEMTEEILRSSLNLYIEQFDPYKIYLLKWEVQPFIKPSQYEMQRYLADYEKQNFTPFIKLDTLIKKSIHRARRLRNSMKSQNDSLFNTELSQSYYDSLPRETFSKHKGELRKRMKEDFVEYVDEQRDRYGKDAVDKRRDHITHRYQKERGAWENGYLYVDAQGMQLNKEKRDHLFTLHVLKAMAKSLDSHTSVFDNSEAYTMRSRLLKGYPGIGLDFDLEIEGIIVTKIASGTPAARSGKVKVDDKLIKIDGKQVSDYTFKDAMKLLEGDEGTLVRLTFQRPAERRPFTIQLKRELVVSSVDRVETSSVRFDHGIIGEITLHSFYDSKNGISSEKDVRDALAELRSQGPLKGLILDLRQNSGGYLSQAVKVAGLFITNGVIVVSKYHDGKVNYYRDVDGKTYFDGPLVVLISRFTASAAEIVAQALQDYGVAVIVGDDRSYGKGSIQSQTVTGDQNSSYFKVTVGKYYTVSGKTPQMKGVLADVVVPGEYVTLNMGEQYLDDPLQADSIEPTFVDKLADIQPEAKPWYFRYYLPTLQSRKTSWQQMIPELKQKSTQRIGRVNGYGLASDKQMDEAVSIIKDMIQLHSKLNYHKVGAYE